MKIVRKFSFFNLSKCDKKKNLNLDKDLQNAKEILSKANKLSTKIMIPIKLGCTVTPAFYILKPIFLDFVNYFFYGTQSTRGIPLKARFFYDETQSPAYELTYLVQAYGTLLVCAYIVSIY